MRIVVMSDSHGAYDRVLAVLRSNPDAEVFFHLGDGLEEFLEIKPSFPDRAFYWVKGNNDWNIEAPTVGTVTLEGRRFFYTHGHLFGVKYGDGTLARMAAEAKADIVLCGHTHQAEIDYRDGVYFLNPGSLRFHGGGGKPGYLRIDITPAGVVPVQVDYQEAASCFH